MKTIIVNSKTHGIKQILVDDEDYIELIKHHWCIVLVCGHYYTTCEGDKINGKRNRLFMHRLLMGFPKDKVIDHIDNNGLNNQKHNLRICTIQENGANRIKTQCIKTTSKYKGIHWHKNNKQWEVGIKKDNKRIFIGNYKTEIEAAKAYNEAAINYFGEFANLNVIEE